MVYERIIEMLCEQLDVEKESLTPETSFIDDLNIDSLDVAELVIAVEDEFGLDQIPEEQMNNLTTIGALAEYVTAHGNV